MIKVLKVGKLKEPPVFIGVCLNCDAIYECEKSDLKSSYRPAGNGYYPKYYYIKCLYCKNEVMMYEK